MSIRLEYQGKLARILISHPARMNALGEAQIRQLQAIATELSERPDIRVILLKAEGEVFGAGGDVQALAGGQQHGASRIGEVSAVLSESMLQIQRLPAILIAGVHGYVAGTSFALMNFADLVVAARFTRFNTGYMRFAASPDGAMSWWLPRLAGYRKAMQWLLFADNLTPEELQACGLINFVVPDEQLHDVLEKMAARVLRAPEQSVTALKKLMLASASQTPEQQIAQEAAELTRLAKLPDFQEAIQAFSEKRQPRFVHDHKV